MDTNATATGRRSGFMLALASAMALVLFAGFARTFFLKPLFDAPPLTWVLALHGVFGTAWFALVVRQAWLAWRGDMARHRAARRIAYVIVGGMIGVTLLQVVLSALDAEIAQSGVPETTSLFIQPTSLAWFAGLFALGMANLRRPDFHKRYMILATVAAMAPAFARITRMFRDGGPPLFDSALLASVFVAALAMHDWRSLGRLHPVTLWAGGLYLVWAFVRLKIAALPAWVAFATPLVSG